MGAMKLVGAGSAVVLVVVLVAWLAHRPIRRGRAVHELDHAPTTEEFLRFLRHLREPVLITRGGCDGWDALEAWSDDYLKQTAPEARFNVECSSSERFGDMVDGWHFREMTMRQFVDAYKTRGPEGRLYLNGRIPAALHGDFLVPAYVPCLADAAPPYARLINMWYGKGGEVSVLHNDLQDNLLHVVRGRKHVALFAPNQTAYLYERRDVERTETRVSPILDVHRCWPEYPLLEEADMLEVTVEEGQVLFIPALWWHQVSSSGEHGTIAVNIWFDFFDYAKRGLRNHVYDTPSDVLWEEMKDHQP